jgi:Domain of unknown function (DUF4158)
MPRRRVLTDAQLEAQLALPTAEPLLVRYYTLSQTDLELIGRRRYDRNRHRQVDVSGGRETP